MANLEVENIPAMRQFPVEYGRGRGDVPHSKHHIHMTVWESIGVVNACW